MEQNHLRVALCCGKTFANFWGLLLINGSGMLLNCFNQFVLFLLSLSHLLNVLSANFYIVC